MCVCAHTRARARARGKLGHKLRRVKVPSTAPPPAPFHPKWSSRMQGGRAKGEKGLQLKHSAQGI